ncbi:MAG: right-handed parallel beta-helix repeat-containing protein [Armatimonadota bacterium]
MIQFVRTLRMLGVLCVLLIGWAIDAYGREVNITEYPYYASTALNDNGPIIQQAINDLLAEGGGTIYIPAGEFKFSTPLLIQHVANRCGSLIIRGDGPHLQLKSKGTDLIFTDRSGAADALTVDGWGGYDAPHFTLRDLALSGGTPSEISYNLNNRKGLVLGRALFSVVENVLVSGFKDAGIYLDNAYYSSVKNTTVASCGIGVDCDGANATSLYHVVAHYCNTAGFRNPKSLIACTIEANDHDGVLYTERYGKYSIHDCYFESNNCRDDREGADIWGNNFEGSNGWPTISLNMSGSATFNGNRGVGQRAYPYRYLKGGFYCVMKGGLTTFTPVSGRAMVDLTKTFLQDCSSELYPANLSWTAAAYNTYRYWNVAQTITNILP